MSPALSLLLLEAGVALCTVAVVRAIRRAEDTLAALTYAAAESARQDAGYAAIDGTPLADEVEAWVAGLCETVYDHERDGL